MGVLFTTRSTYIKDIDERWYFYVDRIDLQEREGEWEWTVAVNVWTQPQIERNHHIPFTTYNHNPLEYMARGYLDDYLYRLEDHVRQFIMDYKTNMVGAND